MVSRRTSPFTPAARAGLAEDVVIARAESTIALWTGSWAMTGEAIHSFADAASGILLFHGIYRTGHRSRQVGSGDAKHLFVVHERRRSRLSALP